MTVSSASLYESKESPEPETQNEQQEQQQNQSSNENEQLPNENVADGPTEVGSSWTKKISAWFSGVRIWTWQRWPGSKNTIFLVLFVFFCVWHTIGHILVVLFSKFYCFIRFLCWIINPHFGLNVLITVSSVEKKRT